MSKDDFDSRMKSFGYEENRGYNWSHPNLTVAEDGGSRYVTFKKRGIFAEERAEKYKREVEELILKL